MHGPPLLVLLTLADTRWPEGLSLAEINHFMRGATTANAGGRTDSPSPIASCDRCLPAALPHGYRPPPGLRIRLHGLTEVRGAQDPGSAETMNRQWHSMRMSLIFPCCRNVFADKFAGLFKTPCSPNAGKIRYLFVMMDISGPNDPKLAHFSANSLQNTETTGNFDRRLVRIRLRTPPLSLFTSALWDGSPRGSPTSGLRVASRTTRSIP